MIQEHRAFDGLADRICKLLGQGIQASAVAASLGCEPSYISQLMADDAFKGKVQELKFAALTEATERDNRLNKLEDKMVDRIEKDVEHNPLAFKNTMERVRALSLVNNMKRRGASADGAANINSTNVVTLILPTQIINRFSANSANVKLDINNQVIGVGDQDLITMQSGSLERLVGDTSNSNKELGDNNEHSNNSKIRFPKNHSSLEHYA